MVGVAVWLDFTTRRKKTLDANKKDKTNKKEGLRIVKTRCLIKRIDAGKKRNKNIRGGKTYGKEVGVHVGNYFI